MKHIFAVPGPRPSIGFALDCNASSYIDHESDDGRITVDWLALTWDRLAWSYGPDRADRICLGKDPKTQADVSAWCALGERSAA